MQGFPWRKTGAALCSPGEDDSGPRDWPIGVLENAVSCWLCDFFFVQGVCLRNFPPSYVTPGKRNTASGGTLIGGGWRAVPCERCKRSTGHEESCSVISVLSKKWFFEKSYKKYWFISIVLILQLDNRSHTIFFKHQIQRYFWQKTLFLNNLRHLGLQNFYVVTES